jgi:predicted nuclease with TOPRIM domain
MIWNPESIENADIIVDLSGGKLMAREYRNRIAALKAENAKLREELKQAKDMAKKIEEIVKEMIDELKH